MELIVLGSSASCPAPGDACSGYLVRHGATEVMLDCGSGVLSKLLLHTSVEALSAIVISHFHPDHYLDLITLRYGLRYGHPGAPKPLVLLPPGGIVHLRNVGMALRGTQDYFTANYRLEEYDPGRPVTVGELKVGFERTAHDIPTWAISVKSPGGARMVYSADTSPAKAVKDFATKADLFLCESTYPADAEGISTHNHLTSVDAATMASKAQVRQLVLTHFWPAFPRTRFKAEAEQVFGAPVGTAESGAHYCITHGAGFEVAAGSLIGNQPEASHA